MLDPLPDVPRPRIDWSALDWNDTALRFYRSVGAHPMTGWSARQLDGEALAALGSAHRRDDCAAPGRDRLLGPVGRWSTPGIVGRARSTTGATLTGWELHRKLVRKPPPRCSLVRPGSHIDTSGG